jgi:anti-anti-sigma regulatory factor
VNLPDSRRSATPVAVTTARRGAVLWITVAGEADLISREVLRNELAAIPVDEVESVHLHVADLTFVDVGCLRELARFAVRVQSTGRRVLTCQARPVLLRAATVLGLEEPLGLR